MSNAIVAAKIKYLYLLIFLCVNAIFSAANSVPAAFAVAKLVVLFQSRKISIIFFVFIKIIFPKILFKAATSLP